MTIMYKRNSPCPCESGKKYKKCCLPKLKIAVEIYQKAVGKGFENEDVALERLDDAKDCLRR